LALATAAFVAFVPQHVAMMAGVENDSLAELLIALTLLTCAIYLKNGARGETLSPGSPSLLAERGAGGEVGSSFQIHPLILGILIGLTLITKITAMAPAGVIIGLAILIRWRQERWTFARLIREFAWVAIPALIFGVPLWVRNMSVYGGLDILAQSAHDHVVVGQPRTDDYLNSHGFVTWVRDFSLGSFQSFWGDFGWMGVPMPPQFYNWLAAFTIFVIVGAGIAAARWRKLLSTVQIEMLMLFGITAFLALAELIYWNLKFVQFQGRYLYPGLIPIALFVVIGLAGWASLIKVRYVQWTIILVVCGFALLDLYALFKFIIPTLS
jgi:hypothetical protein